MAENHKRGSTRKPPAPQENHSEIEEWIAHVMPDLNPIVKHIDDLIRKTLPDVHFAIKWKKAYYGLPSVGWIIEMVAYDVSVNVVFLGGADMATPPPLGSGGRSRYVKLRTMEEAQQPELRAWIEQTADVPGRQ